VARKASSENQWHEEEWDGDIDPDEQVDRLVTHAPGTTTGNKRESGWRRLERYREEKQLKARLREVYD